MATYNLLRRYADGDLALCNCAGCAATLLSPRHMEQYDIDKARGIDLGSLPAFVAGRIGGRPYCPKCLQPNGRGTVTGCQTQNDRRAPGQRSKMRSTGGG
jgi:hypothetical protein